jgi:hypothetical protein
MSHIKQDGAAQPEAHSLGLERQLCREQIALAYSTLAPVVCDVDALMELCELLESRTIVLGQELLALAKGLERHYDLAPHLARTAQSLEFVQWAVPNIALCTRRLARGQATNEAAVP